MLFVTFAKVNIAQSLLSLILKPHVPFSAVLVIWQHLSASGQLGEMARWVHTIEVMGFYWGRKCGQFGEGVRVSRKRMWTTQGGMGVWTVWGRSAEVGGENGDNTGRYEGVDLGLDMRTAWLEVQWTK